MNVAIRVSHLLIAVSLVVAGCGGKGDPGNKGAIGDSGTTGLPGVNGAAGDAGPQGGPGANGNNGNDGANGANGDAGASAAKLSLTVTNSLTKTAVAGATVTMTPVVPVTFAVTGSSGTTSATLPSADYTLSISAAGYVTATQDVELLSGVAQAVTVSLVPAANVYVNAGTDVTGQSPGSTVSLTGTATPLDGSTNTTYSWKQTGGPQATLTNGTNPQVTLPPLSTYRDALIKSLAAPPIAPASLDVTSPTSFPVRLDVLGVNPHSIDDASTVVLTLTATTSSGTYSSTVNIIANVPFQVTTGLRNVPIGVPQVLQAGALPTGASAPTAWNWSVNAAGAQGSTATITDPTSQYPIFLPDVAGKYVLTEAATGGSITLYAGKWGGAIGGVSTTDGLPTIASGCAICHNDTIAPNKWPDWRLTGHAQAFSKNIDDPASNWSVASCASCHTVGYNTQTSAANGGFDDVLTAANWTAPPGAATDYADMFASSNTNVVKLASLANVQCDSCHGPTNSMGHPPNAPSGTTPDPDSRVSIKSEVCGSCHGAPPRYGRYQQWKESLHANYNGATRGVATTANDNATTGDNRANNCARCHTGQGFLAWVDQSTASDGTIGDMNKLLQGAANNGNNGNATGTELRAMGLTAAEVQPQTCATCHDPHSTGNTALVPNNATVRVSGDIGMTAGGFAAVGLGRGAVCAACHNSRNGQHDDTVLATDPLAPIAFGTPHDGPMADVLLGVNAYFVTPGQRGSHSYIADTCATCHMQLTPPPSDLSDNGTGTNHDFKADLTICKNCHGSFNGGSLQSTTQASMDGLATSIANAVMAKLNNGTTGMVIWVRAQDPTTGFFTSSASGTSNVTLDTSSNPITSITLASASTFGITLNAPVATPTWFNGTSAATGPATLRTFNVSVSTLKVDNAGAAGNLVFFAGSPTGAAGSTATGTPGTLYKALWNFGLLTNDQSLGIHNPNFYSNVIGATMTAIQKGAN